MPIEENNIEWHRDNWALALMQRGVIVKLTVARWRATIRLTPEMLGLKFVDESSYQFANKYLALGYQKLLPPAVISQFDSLEREARVNLINYSFETVWGRFVPITAFDEWERENEAIRRRYLDSAIDFGNQFENILLSVKEDYKNLARDVWARIHPENQTKATDSFVESFCQRIVDKIPRREEVISSFVYDYIYFIVPMPSFIEESVAKAKDIQRESELKDYNATLEKQTRKKIAEIYTQRRKELIDGFLEKTVQEMRKYVSELCNEVLLAIGRQKTKGSAINVRQTNKLKRMIKKVKYLNFHNDEEINNLLDELEFEIDKVRGEQDKTAIVDKLERIVKTGTEDFVPKDFSPAIGYLEV